MLQITKNNKHKILLFSHCSDWMIKEKYWNGSKKYKWLTTFKKYYQHKYIRKLTTVTPFGWSEALLQLPVKPMFIFSKSQVPTINVLLMQNMSLILSKRYTHLKCFYGMGNNFACYNSFFFMTNCLCNIDNMPRLEELLLLIARKPYFIILSYLKKC